MDQQLAELEAKALVLQEEQKRLWKEIDQVKEKLFEERLKTLCTDAYVKKLRRVKAYIDAFVAETAYESRGALIENRKMNLRYGFRKMQLPYKDDSYEITQDPLDWMIAEYDSLGMSEHLDIRFDYHAEVIKDFVVHWMTENLPHAEYDDSLFAFRQ